MIKKISSVQNPFVKELVQLKEKSKLRKQTGKFIVEGRRDVLNLLKYGIKNVIAVGGTNIPRTVVDLSKEKITTVFVDGDDRCCQIQERNAANNTGSAGVRLRKGSNPFPLCVGEL